MQTYGKILYAEKTSNNIQCQAAQCFQAVGETPTATLLMLTPG